MTPTPDAVGLVICEQTIVDRGSGNVSLISMFTGRWFDEFPSPPIPFSVFCTLTNSEGRGRMRLEVRDLEDLEVVYEQEVPIELVDRLTLHHIHLRVRTLRFPRPGEYAFEVTIDEERVAERRLRVNTTGEAL